MATIFPREEKTDLLFHKILENPKACRLLTQTVYDQMNQYGDEPVRYLDSPDFAKALFNAYDNRDISALLIALTGNSMFDLLRNSFLIPFTYDEDGIWNPVILSDEEGNLLEQTEIKVPEKDYERFRKEFKQMDDCRMYLAYGWRLRHVYEPDSLKVVTKKYDEHFGVLLLYERPDSLKDKETKSEVYASLLDMMIALQEEMPGATVFYGQDSVTDHGNQYDGLGIFLSKHHLKPSFDQKLNVVTKIIRGVA